MNLQNKCTLYYNKHWRNIMLTVSESAIAKIQSILAEENNPNLKLRVFVQGGGCSGMQYGFTLDEEQAEDDWDLEISGVKVLVDCQVDIFKGP
jgi:iron-sulfur cluster insertion protein